MQKWIIGLVAIILISICCCYLLIPNKIFIEENIIIQANPGSVQRGILEDKKWEKWWPGQIKSNHQHSLFSYNGFTYRVVEKKPTTLVFSITDANFSDTALFHFISAGQDSTLLAWEADLPTATLPIKRAQRFLKSRQISTDLKILLEKARTFFSNADNLYNIHIEKSLVTDSTLLFTSALSKGFPNTEFVYILINKLKNYASAHSAKMTGYPMLNISNKDSINFVTKVALPVDKKLKDSGNIVYKWMLGGGNILTTEVKGGNASIVQALQQLEQYVTDYHHVAPAISFQSLITDRIKEKDTSKWITKIYYPVM